MPNCLRLAEIMKVLFVDLYSFIRGYHDWLLVRRFSSIILRCLKNSGGYIEYGGNV